MKIKKSALLDLIKEEIMSEMDGLTMMDDPYDDDAVPAGIFQEGSAEPVMESPELANINAENIMIFKDAMAKMAPLIATMSLPVLVGMIYEQLVKMGAK